MSLRWVRKRDGRRAPFDPRKLGESVSVAARVAGEEARVPSEEIAEIAALFLEQRFKDRIPETSDIMDLVEKALLETGHARTAAVYAEKVKARARTRRELVVHREGAPVAPDGEPLPAPPGEAWAEGKIVASLERRRVPSQVAEEVAAAVEQKVFGLGWKRIPASLVREIVNAELADRGMSAHLGRPHEVAIPTEEVRQLLVAAYVRRAGGQALSSQGGAEAAVGQDVLARFALAEIYPASVADAHADGRIHIQDLGRPLRLAAAAIALDALKSRVPFSHAAPAPSPGAALAAALAAAGGGSSTPAPVVPTVTFLDDPASREGPRTLGELGARVARTIAALSETHARAIVIPYANVFLAPFLRRRDQQARKDLLDWVRLLPFATVRPVVRLHIGPIPATLAVTPVVGPRGRRWRATYGEQAAQVERCARLLLEALAEDAEMRAAPGETDASRAGGIGVILGLAPSGAPSPGLPANLPLGTPFVAATLEAPSLEPQHARGLATASELVLAAQRGTPVAAGASAVVAINCIRAAQAAGPGDEPALRRGLFQLGDLAIEALAAKWAFLEPALYKPKLPLWQQGGRAAGERVAPGARPSAGRAVAAEYAVHVVALVGFTEAIERVLGEPPSANAHVAAAAADLVRALATRLREQGSRRGLRVRIEEPEIERGRRRLTDLDLVRGSGEPAPPPVPAAPTPVPGATIASPPPGRLTGPGYDSDEADLRYSHGLGGALVSELYAPLSMAPFIEGGALAARARRLLEGASALGARRSEVTQ